MELFSVQWKQVPFVCEDSEREKAAPVAIVKNLKVRITQPECEELSQEARCGFRVLASIIAKHIIQGQVDERRQEARKMGEPCEKPM